MRSDGRLRAAEAEYLADMGWVGASTGVPTQWSHPAILARGLYVPTRLALELQHFYEATHGTLAALSERVPGTPYPVSLAAKTTPMSPEQQSNLAHAARQRPLTNTRIELPESAHPPAAATLSNLRRNLPADSKDR
jgi:hypothetical protein